MTKKVGIVYDPDFLLHGTTYHPERRERLETTMTLLKREGVLDKLARIEPRLATEEEVARVHDENYIRSVREAWSSGRGYLDMDTYLNQHTYEVALKAAGSGLEALDWVMGEGEKVFLLVRPPGHHAERDRGMGFCIFNNIAIAAEAARQVYGLERVLIVDWDVHHGNGTQDSFYDDPGVLFFSVHQSPAYPGTGSLREIGSGKGKGYTINVPLGPGSTDEDYRLAFEGILKPVAEQFKPEIILVSAGQDAHALDPLAGMSVNLAGYRWMTAFLKDLAERHSQGRMLLFLEGGYDLKGLSEAILVVLDELGGWGIDLGREPLSGPRDRQGVEQKIKQLQQLLSGIWAF